MLYYNSRLSDSSEVRLISGEFHRAGSPVINPISGSTINTRCPSCISSFRIIAETVDLYPAMSGHSISPAVTGTRYISVNHIRLITNFLCQCCKCTCKSITVTAAVYQCVQRQGSLPSCLSQIGIHRPVTNMSAYHISPAGIQLLTFRHTRIGNGRCNLHGFIFNNASVFFSAAPEAVK